MVFNDAAVRLGTTRNGIMESWNHGIMKSWNHGYGLVVFLCYCLFYIVCCDDGRMKWMVEPMIVVRCMAVHCAGTIDCGC